MAATSAVEGRIVYHQRQVLLERVGEELDGVYLAINTVNSDPEVSQRPYEAYEARRSFINGYDQPETSNFVMAARVRCGPFRVAFVTGATSLALARALRQEFEPVFDDEFGDIMAFLAQERLRIEAVIPKGRERREALRTLVCGLRVPVEIEYPPAYVA